ncbi:MAG: hypothetical protein NVS2B6_04150 [Thermoleophilaceae bacterium]
MPHPIAQPLFRLARGPIAGVAACFLMVALLPVTASAAVKPKAGKYSGLTSQTSNGTRLGIMFTVRSHGRQISGGRISFTSSCVKSGNMLTGMLSLRAPVTNARFASTGGFPENLNNGYHGQVLADLSGLFTAARAAKGKFHVHVLVYDQSNAQVDDCYSNTVNFTIKHS